jgi:hypothetical protein
MKKIDRIIEAFRNYKNLKEEGMITSVDGPTNKTGPAIANFDPLLGKKKKDGTVDFRRIKPNYRKWIKDK